MGTRAGALKFLIVLTYTRTTFAPHTRLSIKPDNSDLSTKTLTSPPPHDSHAAFRLRPSLRPSLRPLAAPPLWVWTGPGSPRVGGARRSACPAWIYAATAPMPVSAHYRNSYHETPTTNS